MARGGWTFGQKIGAGFAVTVTIAAVIAVVAFVGMNRVVAEKDQVIDVATQILVDAQKLEAAAEQTGSLVRGFLLTGDEKLTKALADSRSEVLSVMTEVKSGVLTDEGRRMAADIERLEDRYYEGAQQVLAMRRGRAALETVAAAYDKTLMPIHDELHHTIEAFGKRQERLVKEAEHAATRLANSTTTLVVIIAGVALVLALVIGFWLTRSLSRQIGTAVHHVQSSSTELQAAANQQATGAKEQATAMNEITTTISELLVTSRQISESAQRVAQIAQETAGAARNGDQTVQRTRDSIAGIKRQVDVVVTQMLDLGKKSQQIGGVLEIINELAEQTNILAINASIEAAGAGEGGKRFGVVAEEIRKLADRVTTSTKEIRILIEDIRASVNATVMATETGSKAVDAGTRQFGDVAAVFGQIAGLVGTTTEASREIELSTKQQTTAVEQVKAAIADVAQATKEMETSSGQTLQTSSQLTGLSRALAQLVRSDAAEPARA